jgi:hypothetical protein
MFGLVIVAPLTGLTNASVASGLMPLRLASQASSRVSASRAAGVASWVVSVPSSATPTVPEFHPAVCAAVTPRPVASLPVGFAPA